MSTRTRLHQDPRYLQLWLSFDWPSPTEQTPVACITFVREVERTRACAATWWMSADPAAIGITGRRRKPDIFWFNLLHEVEHIVLRPTRSSYLNFDNTQRLTDPDPQVGLLRVRLTPVVTDRAA